MHPQGSCCHSLSVSVSPSRTPSVLSFFDGMHTLSSYYLMFSFQWRNISAQRKADYEARAQMQPTQTDTEVNRHTQYYETKKSWYLFM